MMFGRLLLRLLEDLILVCLGLYGLLFSRGVISIVDNKMHNTNFPERRFSHTIVYRYPTFR